ncbi:hypothetical protein JTB14_013925 [Gonioctena quinquepunctata]|nr:hypothetical protein JTB14_013925 [Gonioctena quinquepunctata]
MEELTEVLNPPKKSAPGPDNIPYDFIRYLPDNQKSNLSHIINRICESNISFERHQTITRPTEMRLQETVSELNINSPYAYPIGPNENPPWNSIAPKFHLECNTYRKKDTNRTIFLTSFNTILHTYDRNSLSACQALKNRFNQDPLVQTILSLIDWLHRKDKTICLIRILGHIGIAGNESADQSAKEAADSDTYDDIPVRPSNLKVEIEMKITQQWQR